MKKVLFVSNVLSHIYAFHLPYIKWFKERGFEVHVMANSNGQQSEGFDKYYDVKIERSPFSLKNLAAYKAAKKIIDFEKYDVVHCHTPMGSVIGRLASRKIRKQGAKVLYTAHGFHFYKGAPKINWLLYYTMEKLLAPCADCIITINEEDFNNAKEKFESPKTSIEKISGIGVDINRFSPAEDKDALKKANGYEGKFLLTYAAEFIPRKNHRFFVDAAKELVKKCPDVKILFAGKGELAEETKKYAEQSGVAEYIDFLGFCTNMPDILRMSDILISASIEEGFGINIVEGMASGLPAVVSVVRGHKEMVKNEQNGYLVDVNNVSEFCAKIEGLYNNKERYKEMSEQAMITAEKFSIENSLKQMEQIYKQYIGDEVAESV